MSQDDRTVVQGNEAGEIWIPCPKEGCGGRLPIPKWGGTAECSDCESFILVSLGWPRMRINASWPEEE